MKLRQGDHKRIKLDTYWEKEKEENQKQDEQKAYSERWKNVVYEMQTGRTDFVGGWMSKDVAVRHRTTTYIRTYMFLIYTGHVV
jgi:hypothetical protein